MRVILDVLSCWLISDSDISYQNAATSRLSDRAEPGYFHELSCGHRLAVNKSGSYGTTAGQAVLTAKRRQGIRVRPQRYFVNALIIVLCKDSWRSHSTELSDDGMRPDYSDPTFFARYRANQFEKPREYFRSALSHNLARPTRCDSNVSPASPLPRSGLRPLTERLRF